jgi:hypothetical protein
VSAAYLPNLDFASHHYLFPSSSFKKYSTKQ